MAINNNGQPSWMEPIVRYIEQGSLPSDPSEENLMNRRTTSYSIIEWMLYQRGLLTTLLKCLEKKEVVHTLVEVHKGIKGEHLSAKALVKMVLRGRYYLLNLAGNAKEYARRCDLCQQHVDLDNALPSELHSLTSYWIFSQ